MLVCCALSSERVFCFYSHREAFDTRVEPWQSQLSYIIARSEIKVEITTSELRSSS